MHKYIDIPKEVSFNLIGEKKSCLAPSKYNDFYPNPNVNFRILSSLIKPVSRRKKIERNLQYKYVEIGDIDVSNGYVDSNDFFGYFLPSESPLQIQKDDILISTVRTYRRGIGMVQENSDNLTCTPAIFAIREVDPEITKEYLLAVLRSDFFIEQILSLQNRGMYPRLDNDSADKIVIPIPKASELKYITDLSRALINKNKLIVERNNRILELVEQEIRANQKPNDFNYSFPNLAILQANGRIDAGFYSEHHYKAIFETQNYVNGYFTLNKAGLQLIPGPSLEIKLLGTRIDSDIPVENFYRLVTPKQFSNYGTITYYEYLGTPKRIAPIQFGDILFGESGTGRSIVYLDDHTNTINNAHAHILRPIKGECTLEKAITIRAILAYYKKIGVIDHLTVGGSGGHLSPSYFDRVFIPCFNEEKQKEIAAIYYNPRNNISGHSISIDDFQSKDDLFNMNAGITELDKTAKLIKQRLDIALDQIVTGQNVTIDFNFYNN